MSYTMITSKQKDWNKQAAAVAVDDIEKITLNIATEICCKKLKTTERHFFKILSNSIKT